MLVLTLLAYAASPVVMAAVSVDVAADTQVAVVMAVRVSKLVSFGLCEAPWYPCLVRNMGTMALVAGGWRCALPLPALWVFLVQN